MDLWGNDLRVDQVSEAIKCAADSAAVEGGEGAMQFCWGVVLRIKGIIGGNYTESALHLLQVVRMGHFIQKNYNDTTAFRNSSFRNLLVASLNL